MNKYTIAIDLGYGQIKGINQDNKRVIFPSIISSGKDRSLDTFFNSIDNIVDNIHVKILDEYFNEKEYFVGELAKRQPSNSSFINRDNKINSEENKVLLATALGLLIPNDLPNDSKIHIVTGLPLEHFIKQKQALNDMLKDFEHTIKFVDHNFSRNIKFEESNITLFPQGAGAIFSKINNDISSLLIKETFIGLIDVGFKTTDIVVFRINKDKEPVFEQEMSATLDGLGMINIYNTMDKAFTDNSRDGSKLNTEQLMLLCEEGKIFFKGDYIDLKKDLIKARKTLSTNIINKADGLWGSRKNSFNSIMIAGGGGKVLYNHLKLIEPNMCQLIDNPEFANAIGYLEFGKQFK
ncbi:ParM/StbA family protein [Clostridium botulinum]|uniref:ParM/StbA family protein n=1 Tax=Clostridium botulinum TaxID=1491 RepID=UPI0005F8B369